MGETQSLTACKWRGEVSEGRGLARMLEEGLSDGSDMVQELGEAFDLRLETALN